RRRLEPGRDREPRHRLFVAHAEDARADRGDEGALDAGDTRISRRDRQIRHDPDLAKAGTEAAPAGHPRRRFSLGGAPRGALRRRLVPERGERQPGGIHARLPQDGAGGRARSRLIAGHDRRRTRRSRCAEAVPRSGRSTSRCYADVGDPRPAPTGPRPLGRPYPAIARLSGPGLSVLAGSIWCVLRLLAALALRMRRILLMRSRTDLILSSVTAQPL